MLERRLLILTPIGRDADLARGMLGEVGIDSVVCSEWTSLTREFEAGAGALLIAEEALDIGGASGLVELIARQPPWSDLPVLILTSLGANSAVVQRASSFLGNVTLLERPIRVAALISAVRTALRARERQYQIRTHLIELDRAADALRLSESRLREANLRKDEFLATLAHELRNPLAPVRNAVQILKMRGLGELQSQWSRDVIDRQVQQMARLLDDLLDVSRITRGQLVLRRERVSVRAAIEAAIETARPLIDAKAHTLEVEWPSDAVAVEADPVRMTQILGNLLINAAKYTDSGGRIRMDVTVSDVEVVIRVRDNGIGMTSESLSRLFEMFTQGSGATGRSEGGLGVGLAITKGLVELHGGRIEAHSEGAGRGSEFSVVLPLPP